MHINKYKKRFSDSPRYFQKVFGTAVMLFLGAFLSGIACATYPDKPVKLVVPYTPGGAADQLGRAIGDRLSKEFGQPVVVENKPGASTRVAATYVANSQPDGYTLILGSNASMVLNPLLYKKTIKYDANDFKVVSLMVEMPLVVVANPTLPANNLDELKGFAKQNKGKLNYASVGLGNPLHLATEMLNQRAGIEMLHVPYNGSAPALASLMANDTQIMVDGVITSLPLIRGGKIKPLAVMSEERLEVLPDVPTVAESGYPGFKAATWFGVAVPAEVPDEIAMLLNDKLNKILVDDSFIEQFKNLGMVVQKPRSLKEIGDYVGQDNRVWSKLIEDNQIQLD